MTTDQPTLFGAPSKPTKTPYDWRPAVAERLGTTVRHLGDKATPEPCGACGAWTIAGWDSKVCANLAKCDPIALTTQALIAAVILDRPTWRLFGTPGNWRLATYSGHGLHIWGPTTQPVLPGHQCGTTLPGTRITLTAVAAPCPDQPPF